MNKEEPLLCGLTITSIDFAEAQVDYREGRYPKEPSCVSTMPEKLTAENGAKALLMGEFYEQFRTEDEEGNEVINDIPVSWITIKEIYKMIVKHFSS